MRLRSSQLVFLLLLVCTVQVPQEHALRWMADEVSSSASTSSSSNEAIPATILRTHRSGTAVTTAAALIRLDAASLSAHRTAWDMRRPALRAAAIASYTSLLRA